MRRARTSLSSVIPGTQIEDNADDEVRTDITVNLYNSDPPDVVALSPDLLDAVITDM
jgi:hypothetical protein